MARFSKSYEQAADLFRGMTPGARLVAALLAAVVLISFGYLTTIQASSGSASLFDGQQFSFRELNAMQAAFAKAGLQPADVSSGRILVPRSKRREYLAALSDADALPSGFQSAFDSTLGDLKWYEPESVRLAKLLQSRKKELARILTSFSYIDEATVEYDEVARGGFPPRKEKTATIAVSAYGGKQLEPGEVISIRRTVVGGFAGLKPENVTVTDLNHGIAYPGRSQGPYGHDQNVYAAAKTTFERDWAAKIQESLSYIPGANVQVNVELNPEISNVTDKLKFDQQTTALETSSRIKSSQSNQGAGGVPGASSNGVPQGNQPARVATVSPSGSTTEDTQEAQRGIAGHEQVVTHRAPLTPLYVTASVGVPRSYLRAVWDRKHPTPEGEEPTVPTDAELQSLVAEEKKELESIVQQLLPPMPAEFAQVNQVNVSFQDRTPIPAIAGPGMATQALGWFAENWPTLGMLLLGLISILYLRSMMNAQPSPDNVAAPSLLPDDVLDELADTSTVSEASDSAEAPSRFNRNQNDGESLREELISIVKEDPDAAANVLRTWIGDAA